MGEGGGERTAKFIKKDQQIENRAGTWKVERSSDVAAKYSKISLGNMAHKKAKT